MHANSERVAETLRSAGVAGVVRELDASTRTAAEAATAIGCAVGAIANSLVFMADDAPVLVLASGARRVDTGRLAAALGAATCRRASAEEVRAATGQPIGGVAPVGHPTPLRTVIDVALRAHPQIWAAGGTPRSVFPTDFDELRRVCRAEEATLA